MLKRWVLIVGLTMVTTTCTDADGAKRVLTQNGYKDIVLSGYAAWSCGKDDNYATKFTATSPSGQRVTGAVCRGWLKGSTIRFD